MIKREISKYILSLKGKYPVITITGPRQSGKTTLARATFPRMKYVNLEDLEERDFALNDPKGFLARFPEGAIIDEIQRVANLCSYIQVIVDKPGFKGLFVLTGSQNFAVRNTLNQSLAGRTAVLTLLPFSLKETAFFRKKPSRDEILFYGFYPPLHDRGISPTRFYHDYVQTYIERDLRQISLIHNLSLFQKFMGLCAGRTGQLLNYESLGNDTGISQTTVMEWLSILEASYIVFRLPPFYKNVGKDLSRDQSYTSTIQVLLPI